MKDQIVSKKHVQSHIIYERYYSWIITIPCTNPANNKTFDHRQVIITSLTPNILRTELQVNERDRKYEGLDGWLELKKLIHQEGAEQFVRAAARILTHGDWVVLSSAAYMEMHDSPAAFDLLSGLIWGLRDRAGRVPSKNVAWLVLKLMASVPSNARIPHANAAFSPLQSLPKRQINERRQDRSVRSPYPISFPRGHRLEADLRYVINKNLRQRKPKFIDWIGLCHSLEQLLD